MSFVNRVGKDLVYYKHYQGHRRHEILTISVKILDTPAHCPSLLFTSF